MKLPNLSEIIKFPKFSIIINNFIIFGLFVFYLAMIIRHFSIKTFEKFTPQEAAQINGLSRKVKGLTRQINRQRKINNSVMTKLIPGIQKNINDLSNKIK